MKTNYKWSFAAELGGGIAGGVAYLGAVKLLLNPSLKTMPMPTLFAGAVGFSIFSYIGGELAKMYNTTLMVHSLFELNDSKVADATAHLMLTHEKRDVFLERYPMLRRRLAVQERERAEGGGGGGGAAAAVFGGTSGASDGLLTSGGSSTAFAPPKQSQQ